MWDVKVGRVGKSVSVIDDNGSSSTADTPYEKLRHQVSKCTGKESLHVSS